MKQGLSKKEFLFADHAEKFDDHIDRSIPGYSELRATFVKLSRNFARPNTRVVDIGCSSGAFLKAVREENQATRPAVDYMGIDVEANFKDQWLRAEEDNLKCEVADARTFEYTNTSLAVSMFTLQFLPPPDKLPLLKRIYRGLNYGGAMLIAEKHLASSSRLQDIVTFPYYDKKIERGFSEKEILDKERGLRGVMSLWTQAELERNLRQAGFREFEVVWEEFLFSGYVAIKT